MTYRGWTIKLIERKGSKLPGYQWIASKNRFSAMSACDTKPNALADAKRFIDSNNRKQ